ncbi:caspase-8 [Uranotaenia lowii]|uniref:caspase-8 n=1 Tax=Uranotaenia lowii TaxID=190385 RepID=UPI0024797BBA|nr:caspase-8 [Uranotaenia lowii]
MSDELSVEDLDFLESQLDFQDKVSLLFLLYGHRDPHYLLQTLTVARKTPEQETHLLGDWMRYVTDLETGVNWSSEVLEALSIIQANLALLKCGFDDDAFTEKFLPKIAELASFVNPVLKGLYILCEKVDDIILEKVVRCLKSICQVKLNEREYFELVLLELVCQGSIKLGRRTEKIQCDLLNLVAVFKNLERDDLGDFCKTIASNFNNESTTSPNQSDNIKDSQCFEQDQPGITIKDNAQIDRYFIARKNAGIILIVNQFEFYRETNPELAELLPSKPLNNRRGTDVDKLAILNLFVAFGYQAIVVENIPHYEILRQVEAAVDQIKSSHCSLIVAILSHGQEGKVYGSNSIPLNVKSIEKAMAAEKLTGKPKLLFVQACQGVNLQSAVEVIQPLEHDGPSSERTASVFVDFLVAWSTVPGFASVRHIEKGSWFIQELCTKLRAMHGSNHLMDILTAVIDDVSSKRGYGNECMVPILYSTLRKKLYFEPL